MKIKIRFLGAARNVTGSQYVVEANNQRVMIDCGYYQERALQERNWQDFKLPPSELDAVLLTHAHLDHCGLLPKLGNEGLRANIFCTPATGDIAKIVMGGMKQVAEGIWNAKAARDLAVEHEIEMPITEEVCKIVEEGKDPRQALKDLMAREPGAE